MPAVESNATVAAPPADVFAFLHDPAQRPVWDVSVDPCNLEGEAPSWVGEYVEVASPRRSVLRLVDGVGMPFSDYRQTIEVAGDGGGTMVTLRLEYSVRGPLVLVERFTVRGRLARALHDSARKVEMRFA